MRLRNRPRDLLATGVLAVLLGVSVADAHRATRTQRPAKATAVVVVGKPKPVSRVVVVNGARQGVLDLNVRPKETEVWVDGRLRGTCGEFDGHPDKLNLRPGMHSIRLVTPEGIVAARDIRVRAGIEINVGLDLR